MSTTTFPRNASAVMQRLLAVALIVFTPFLIPAHATDLSLGYDANGNVNSKTTPSGTSTFNYDALDRLQIESGPEGARTHVYDPNGNRTSDTAGTTVAYTPNTDKLQTINGITVTLDATGNLTRDGTYIYVWNALNQLAELHKADNTLIASYFYDYQNRRSRKVTTAAAPQGATTTYYTYDEQNHLIAETGPGNQPIATYVWNGDTLTGFITYQPTRTVYTVQVDQLGSPFQARTLAGTVVWRWESEAYGKTQPNQDVDGDDTKLTLNLRFPGQYYDQESGLHYNWNRYYSPKLGRYISPDPIGLSGGANLFAYAGGNPLSYVDPRGLTNAVPGGPGEWAGSGSYVDNGEPAYFPQSDPSIFPSAKPLAKIGEIGAGILLPPLAVGAAGACITSAASAAATVAAANARNAAICVVTGFACVGGAGKGLEAALRPAQTLVRRIQETKAIRPVENLRRNTGTVPPR